ncbi:MAG: NAD(P)/FAD-dependent oxidoreductase, partial [Candidatus Pacebacteria bacterium]|nr:NAD(P)/FAD-dependent oxidoreductase [Candidatus Paceibacterota bacterium]
MQEFKYLIIGGGIAGTTAAETVRQKDSEGSIAIVNDEPYRLYSRVMLSKQNWFLGKIPFERIWLKTEKWYQEKNIAFLGGKTATSLNKENKTVTLDNGDIVKYEKLLIATGGQARMWPVQGANKQGIHYCRTLDQGKGILNASKTAKKAVIIGSGFVSFEIAELFKLSGIDVTIVMREDHYWEPLLEKAGADIVEKAIAVFGIHLIKNVEVQEVLGKDHVESVLLKNGEKIDCDIIVCGIGIVFDNTWLQDTGIEINRGIVTNEYLETTQPDIWAAGDIAEYDDIILEECLQMCNWANAREHGRIAGLNMAGEKTPYKFVSFYNAQGMGMNIAFIGNIRPSENKIVIQRND